MCLSEKDLISKHQIKDVMHVKLDAFVVEWFDYQVSKTTLILIKDDMHVKLDVFVRKI